MAKFEIVAQSQDMIADGRFRPVQNGKGEWNCVRLARIEGSPGNQARHEHEIYGARMDGPEGVRFAPLNLFHQADAHAFCDKLNKERGNG